MEPEAPKDEQPTPTELVGEPPPARRPGAGDTYPSRRVQLISTATWVAVALTAVLAISFRANPMLRDILIGGGMTVAVVVNVPILRWIIGSLRAPERRRSASMYLLLLVLRLGLAVWFLLMVRAGRLFAS